MQKRNNVLVLLAAILLTFLCTLPMQWATFVTPPFYLTSFTGISGHMHLFFDLPIWFLVFLSAIAVGISATNIASWTTIKVVPFSLLLFSGVHYSAGVFFAKAFTSDKGTVAVGAGPFVALLATIVAMAIALWHDSRNANA